MARDAELKYSKGGKPYTEVRLLQDRWTPDGKETDHADCAIFFKSDDNAEKSMNFLRQGNLISVEGRLNNSSWEGKDGKKMYRTNIMVRNYHFLAASKKNQAEGGTYREDYEDDGGF